MDKSPSNNSVAPKTILVIEDDVTLLKMIRLKLEAVGFRVLSAGNGERGLEILEQEKPDLVWLDLLLPGIQGLEVLRRIREKESTRDTSVIVVSAFGTENNISEASQLAVSEFIVKGTVQLDDIISRVSRHAKP